MPYYRNIMLYVHILRFCIKITNKLRFIQVHILYIDCVFMSKLTLVNVGKPDVHTTWCDIIVPHPSCNNNNMSPISNV